MSSATSHAPSRQRKLLVANRSEIAIRVFRAATELGFRTVATVAKRRVEYRLPGPPPIVVSLDEVEGLGRFCEVETAATDVATGRRVLEAALRLLGLEDAEPIATSYLELLLHRA